VAEKRLDLGVSGSLCGVQPHVEVELRALADACDCVGSTTRDGWTTEQWSLTEECRVSLLAAYRRALIPASAEPAVQRLVRDGVDIWSRMRPANEQHELVIRGDLGELAAAAAMLARGEVSRETLKLANVPKGSARTSEHGFDAVALQLAADTPEDGLADGDVLVIGTAKHTLDDPAGLLTDLVKSISDTELSSEGSFARFRLYHGFLEAIGFQGRDKIWLILEELPDATHLRLVASAFVDATMLDELETRVSRIQPSSQPRMLRRIGIRDLETIHAEVESGT
jgi:hypothetical protein